MQRSGKLFIGQRRNADAKRKDLALREQEAQGWGSKVIDRLAGDLRHEFPEMKGFSSRNLKYMRAFAEAWPDAQFVQQAAAQSPWFHNCVIMDKLSNAVALRDTRKPIGVSGCKLTGPLPKKLQGKLPTIKELEAELTEEKD